jgi:hypothetical protein
MSWFFIALWAPFLLTCATHTDKFLLSRYLKEKSIGPIVIVSALFSVLAIPIELSIRERNFKRLRCCLLSLRTSTSTRHPSSHRFIR